ncbi:MAG: PrsW family intramembrane metalloprotease [Chloroflexota bacterium]|nr:PrsW family intramembrane metalloprotease [Chloroflexota bacterium]
MKILPFGGARASVACPRCGAAHAARQQCPAEKAEATPASTVATAGTGTEGIRSAAAVTAAERAAAAARLRSAPRPAPLAAPQPAMVWPTRRRPRVSAVGRALRWTAASAATVVLISCVTVIGARIGELTHADQDTGAAIVTIAVSIGIGLVFGMGLMYVSARTYAKVVFAGLSLFLVTAGSLLMTLAPVVRQANTAGLAPQAFAVLLWFGALSLACGVVLGLACLRWAAQRTARQRLARWARLAGSAYGVLLGISGLFGMFALLFVGAGGASGTSTVERALSITAVAMWSLVPGLILTYQGISASMGEGSSPFHIPRAAWIAAAFGAVLGLGWLITTRDVPAAAPMPPLHVLAAALPGIALVAMAARGSVLRGAPVRWLTWRQVLLAAAISMTVGVMLATYVESLGSFLGVVLLLVHNGAFASVQDSDGFFRTVQDSRFILTHNEQFFANLITASLLAPLIEELGKGLGVRFLLRRDTTRSQAFVLGAAAGAGFGFLEAMLYGVAGVQHGGPGGWAAIMLVRGGSTSLHVVNTGLVGLAWWYGVNGGRPRTGWLLFALAVFNHAAWNGFATAIDSRILGLDTLSGHALEVVAYVVVGIVSVAFVAAVPLIARRLRRADAVPPVSGPLASMAPWLG